MSASEIIRAYEAGLITQNEALEQAQVDDFDSLYQRLGDERRSKSKRPQSSAASKHLNR